jgi:hypothetical protein
MSSLTSLLLLLQASTVWVVSPATPTVGDTVVLAREMVVAAPGAQLQLQPLEESAFLVPLVDPQVVEGPEGRSIRYTVALFRAGEQNIEMPEIELLLPDGRTESVPGGIVVVRVASVLPAGDSLPAAQPAQGPVARTSVRVEPAFLLGTAVLVIMAGWGYYRRRSQPRPVWETTGDEYSIEQEDENPVMRWVVAGEPRAVAALTMHRLREHFAEAVPRAARSLGTEECLRVIAEEQPDWPLRAIGEVVQSLERASFAPAVPSDVMALADEADELLRLLANGELEAEETS